MISNNVILSFPDYLIESHYFTIDSLAGTDSLPAAESAGMFRVRHIRFSGKS